MPGTGIGQVSAVFRFADGVRGQSLYLQQQGTRWLHTLYLPRNDVRVIKPRMVMGGTCSTSVKKGCVCVCVCVCVSSVVSATASAWLFNGLFFCMRIASFAWNSNAVLLLCFLHAVHMRFCVPVFESFSGYAECVKKQPPVARMTSCITDRRDDKYVQNSGRKILKEEPRGGRAEFGRLRRRW
jgi:hypothetical protein